MHPEQVARDWDELCKAEVIPELHGAATDVSCCTLCVIGNILCSGGDVPAGRNVVIRSGSYALPGLLSHWPACAVACVVATASCCSSPPRLPCRPARPPPTLSAPADTTLPPAPAPPCFHGQAKQIKDGDSDNGSAGKDAAVGAEGVVGAGHPERTPAPLRDLRKSRVS